jgi:hypothetical protein
MGETVRLPWEKEKRAMARRSAARQKVGKEEEGKEYLALLK